VSARNPGTLVVGLGQWAAGDDGVGLLVARFVAAQGVAALESSDATVLVTLLAEGRRVILVDAIVGAGKAGQVLHLRPDDLAEGQKPVSCHGIGVPAALALAGTLHGTDVLRAVDIVGVTVDGEPTVGSAISSAVAAAVEPATALAVRLARSRM
jgi:hydrogenase maturation protease